jgi:hypothetical protein
MEYRLRYRLAHLTQVEDFDFIDFTPFIEEPDKITFNFGQSDTNNSYQLDSTGIDKAVSSKMVVFGDAYNYVKDWLIDDPFASINSIKVEIYDMMCAKCMGIWEIKAANLQWCIDGECKLELNLTEYTPKGNCLKNTLISDNHRNWFPEDGIPWNKPDNFAGINNPPYVHPMFKYCDDVKPQFVQNFIFAVAHGLVISLNTILAPILFIALIVEEVCGLLGISWTPLEDLQEKLDEFYADIFEKLLGCERMHPAPLVRNYFLNACSKCKVNFESNIFYDNSPDNPHRRYFDTCHMFAPVSWGIKEDDVNDYKRNWLPKNAPYDSLLAYAYSLKDIFNAKFKLEKGTFSFHSKDTFPETIVFDFYDEHKHLMISPMCYGWNAQKKYQSTTFEFAQDIKDIAGDEALHRYNGTKDWTEGMTGANRDFYDGINEIKSELYAATRFSTDGIDRKLIFKKLDEQDFWDDGVILMDKDVCQLGKLIVWDREGSFINDAKAVKVSAMIFYDIKWVDDWVKDNPDPTYHIYNYPMFFDWKTNEGNVAFPPFQTHKNLYELHKIDDPTQNNIQNKTWETTLELCCTTLNLLLDYDSTEDGIFAHLDYLVKLNPTEKGSIKRLEIDYDKAEIRLSGEIKYT